MGIQLGNLQNDTMFPDDFADKLTETYSQDDPRKPKYNTEDPNEKAQRLIAQMEAQREKAESRIGELETGLDFDPRTVGHKRWKSRYKWKGASPLRKLGSIGMGVADVLSVFSKSGSIYNDFQKSAQQEFENRKSVIPGQITNQRQLITNANNVIQDENDAIKKKEANLAQIELKKLLDSTSNPTEYMRIQNEAQRLLQSGDMTRARVALLGSQKNLTDEKVITEKDTRFLKTPLGAAEGLRLMSPEAGAQWLGNTEKISKALNAGRADKTFKPIVLPEGGVQTEVKFDPITNGFIKSQVTPRTAYKVTGDGMTLLPQPEGMTSPNSPNKRFTPAEMKTFTDMEATAKLLDNTTATILNDIYTGTIDSYSGFNDTHIGRMFQGMFTDDPVLAATRANAPQNLSIATLQHLKAMYGGRAPQALAQDLDRLIAGTMQNGIGKASAAISQKYIAEMYLMDKVGDPRAQTLYSDPNFYGFLKEQSANMIRASENAKKLGRQDLVPRVKHVNELMNMYLERQNRKKAAPKQQASTPAGQTPVIVNKTNSIMSGGLAFINRNKKKE